MIPPKIQEGGEPTEYFALYLDPRLHHSAGYFADVTTTLADAQAAKVDSILGKCRLERETRLLDVGCGWGTAMIEAARSHEVRAIGLTVSRTQYEEGQRLIDSHGAADRVEIRLQPWETFDEPVDRIICINAFENFVNKERFFAHCRRLLPRGAIVVVLTVTAERPLFRVLAKRRVVELAREAGFTVECSASLAAHYVRTLECFVENLTRVRTAAIR